MECNEQEQGRSEQETTRQDEQEALEHKTRADWESSRSSFEAWAAESGEPLSEFDRTVERSVEFARVNYQKERAYEELTQLSVRWKQITAQEVASLQELLDSNPDEQTVHIFLEGNPNFLVQVLGGGHGRYQIPKSQSKPRLGSQYVPDFLISDMNSMGIHWYAIELESPRKRAFRNDGIQTSDLTQAISQITDWRDWLRDNIDYARRPKEQSGLGLIGIESRLSGLILIGRRDEYPERYNRFRRDMLEGMRIAIHSYDWLVDAARNNSSGRLTSELPR